MSSEEEYEEVRELLKWNMAILTVLLDQRGGSVEISKDTLGSIDLSKTKVQVRVDEERDLYIIEGVYE